MESLCNLSLLCADISHQKAIREREREKEREREREREGIVFVKLGSQEQL